MSDAQEAFLDSQRRILQVVDQLLDEWKSGSNYQVPLLLLNMATRLNWDADQLRKYDPLVRLYLKDHPMWYVTRGPHGGIMPRAEHDKKEADAAAKKLAKEELKARIAAATVSSDVIVPVEPTNESDDDI